MKIIDKKTIADILSEKIKTLNKEEIKELLEVPPSEIDFTYAFPCFRLAKTEKKSPDLIAKDLENEIKNTDVLDDVKAVGSYLNLKVKSKYILEPIFKLQEDYGRIRETMNEVEKKKKRIVIEYPSPNTNKPLHFGHIRNILLGKSLSNLLDYKGNKVFQVNLYNNRGIHICKSMLAYKKWGVSQDPNKKPDHFVGDFYVMYSKMAEKDPTLEQEAYDLLRLWENGDKDTIDLWKKMNNWALEGFDVTFKKLDISFDKVYYESDLYLKGKEIILDGLRKGIFQKTEDGAIYAKFDEKYKLPDKFLIRSDGTTIYITQDIYLAYKKQSDFNYDRSIHVVGDPQIQHFKWLFALLEMLGFKGDNYHLAYGMIELPSGKMKSREGTVVDGDDVLEEVENLALIEVNKRYPNIDESEKVRRANSIGLAAIKFFILKYNANKGFIFKPDESISFEGETGPYILYCYARIESILSKSDIKVSTNINWDL
ncbi:MAG: arginine--tRNA ligase, partial [Candidatus Thorarchaeota archaeon]